MNLAALGAIAKGDINNFLAASTPGGIEAQEAQGQRDLINSSLLPKEVRGATREQLEAIGFKFGADADALFVNVELPTGWSMKATEHSMHSELLDASGVKRAGIFYKAAFYDRRAYMSMSSRYFVKDDYAKPVSACCVFDSATSKPVHTAGTAKYGDYAAMETIEKRASAWLADHYPDHANPLAYW